MSCQFVLYGAAYKFKETVFFLVLSELLFELRGEYIQQLVISRDEGFDSVGGTENDDIPGRAKDDVAAEAALYQSLVRSRLNILRSERIDGRAASVSSERAHP